MDDCIIVGAGIAGMMAASELAAAGLAVRVLEKGRGVGGRMATRRKGEARFDHGAQFFTARDERFRSHVKDWRERGLVEPWYTMPESGTHYRAAPGMTAIAKHLASRRGIAIERNCTVAAVHRDGQRWTVERSDGGSHSGRALLLTAPVPQSLALLDAGGMVIEAESRRRLQSIRFLRCIAALCVLSGPSALTRHGGAAKLDGQPVQWIADNQRKGVSPTVPTATIHSTAEFADEHWNSGDDARIPPLLDAALPHLGVGVESVEIHRWGFSQPVGRFSEDAFVDRARALAIAGDGIVGGRVEGAAVSGLHAAGQLLAALADLDKIS